jgi:hypothetical protein
MTFATSGSVVAYHYPWGTYPNAIICPLYKATELLLFWECIIDGSITVVVNTITNFFFWSDSTYTL